MEAAQIEKLIAEARYNADTIAPLEQFLAKQVESGTYHKEANLALLKLYQFHPSRSNFNLITKIFLKALMQLPSTDFLLCTYLVPESIQSQTPHDQIAKIAAHLETGHYTEFWAHTKAIRETLNLVPGFDNAIRAFIIHTVQLTYNSIRKDNLAGLLSIETSELNALVEEKQWENDVTSIKFPVLESVRLQKVKKSNLLGKDQMDKILSTVSH